MSVTKTVEVAVIGFKEFIDYECYAEVAQSITDWKEVSWEEAKALDAWVGKKSREGYSWQVIHRVPNYLLPALIDECLEEARKLEEKNSFR